MRRALVRFRLARGSTSRPLATVAGSFSARLSDSLVQLQREWNHLAHVQADLQDSMPACSAADLPSLHKRLHQSYTLLLKSVVLDPEAHVNDVLVVFDSICTRYPPTEDDLLHMVSASLSRLVLCVSLSSNLNLLSRYRGLDGSKTLIMPSRFGTSVFNGASRL